MKKGEFDLTGKAVDCSGLPALNDAGKEIFRALKLALGFDVGVFDDINAYPFLTSSPNGINYTSKPGMHNNKIIQPTDVLGQAAIDAAMDGATIVFEGNIIPNGKVRVYWSDDFIEEVEIKGGHKMPFDSKVVACKLLEKTPSIESKIISEKMGFKELAPIDSGEEWKGRELEVYDDLRDAHLDLIRENMEKDKEIELLKQRIKDMHRTMNDAKACLYV